MPNCPQCHAPVEKVTYPSDSMLNEYQWDSVRAGDWYCPTCPPNNRSKTQFCYWWDKEVEHPTTEPARAYEYQLRSKWEQEFRVAIEAGTAQLYGRRIGYLPEQASPAQGTESSLTGEVALLREGALKLKAERDALEKTLAWTRESLRIERDEVSVPALKIVADLRASIEKLKRDTQFRQELALETSERAYKMDCEIIKERDAALRDLENVRHELKVLAHDYSALAREKEEQADLRAQVERLTFLHNLDHSLADQWQAKNEQLEKEVERLTGEKETAYAQFDDLEKAHWKLEQSLAERDRTIAEQATECATGRCSVRR